MPTYVFRCPGCGRVKERQRPMAASGNPATCMPCYVQGAPAGNMVRVFTAPNFIIRPSGWNLHPDDPGYSDFNRELELGEVRGPSHERRWHDLEEDEMPATALPQPSYEAMRELHQMGEVMDHAIQERDDLPSGFGEGSSP